MAVPNYPPSQPRVRGTRLGRAEAKSYRKNGRGLPEQGLAQGPGSDIPRGEFWGLPQNRCSWLQAQIPGLWTGGEQARSEVLPCSMESSTRFSVLLGHLLDCLDWANASSLHLRSVSRFLSNVTHSFLSLSICPFTQSVHGEPILGPVLQGIPQGAHSQLGIWPIIQRSTGGREIRAGVGDAQTLGIRRKFPEKVMRGFES